MRAVFAGLLFFLSGCTPESNRAAAAHSTSPAATGNVCPAPFVYSDPAKVSARTRAVLKNASEDFCAVLQDREPVHALADPTGDLPMDGGTTFYKGDGYQITKLQSLSTFGDFHGMAKGPIIKFDHEFAPGNTDELSMVRVYQLSPRD